MSIDAGERVGDASAVADLLGFVLIAEDPGRDARADGQPGRRLEEQVPASDMADTGRPAVPKNGGVKALDPSDGIEQHPAPTRGFLGRVESPLPRQQQPSQLPAGRIDFTGLEDHHKEQHQAAPLALVGERRSIFSGSSRF